MNKKHLLMMIACCLLPLLGLGAILLFNIPLNTALWGLMLVICPVSHLLMMKFMGHEAAHPTKQKSACHTSEVLAPKVANE